MIFVATRGRLKFVPAVRKKSIQKSIDNVAVRKKSIQKSIDNVAVRKVARFRMVVYRQTAPGQKWLLLPITTCFGLRVVWIYKRQTLYSVHLLPIATRFGSECTFGIQQIHIEHLLPITHYTADAHCTAITHYRLLWSGPSAPRSGALWDVGVSVHICSGCSNKEKWLFSVHSIQWVHQYRKMSSLFHTMGYKDTLYPWHRML